MTQQLLQEGLRHYEQGNHSAASRCFSDVLKRDNNSVPALNLLAMVYVNSERAAEAVPLIEKALKLKPDDHQAMANLGLAYQRLGQLEQAEHQFRRSLELSPRNPKALQSLGTVLADSGHFAEAVRCFERSLRLHPPNPQAWISLSRVLVEQGRPKRAMQAAREALKVEPEMPEAMYQLAELYRKASRFDQAVQAYKTLIQQSPAFLDGYLGLAVAYRQMEDSESALALLQQTIEAHPEFAQAHSALGVLHEQLGDGESAAACFQRAIALAPEAIKPHAQLAMLKGHRSSDEELAALERLRQCGGHPDDELSELCFGLGEAYHQRGEHDKAFDAWYTANTIRARRNPYPHGERLAQRDEILAAAQAMPPQRLEQRQLLPGPRMVFVIGMPRSGTSLTDQVLSAHSAVASLGEVSYSEDMSHQLKELAGAAYPAGTHTLSAAQLDSLRNAYLARIPEALAGAAIVLDKTPMNFQYLALLAEVFPDALFIHCHRNPVDNCFSIYRLPFSHDQDYAHDLVALGQHYRLYRDMMEQWKALYPGRILDVRYEDTVDDLQAQAERLAAFLEISYQAAMLEFYSVKRLVRTPSASQVRQPIYKSAVQAWRSYETQLQPLTRSLGDLAAD